MDDNESPALQYLRKYQAVYSGVTGLKHAVDRKVVHDFYDRLLNDPEFLGQVKALEKIESAEEFKNKFIHPFDGESDFILHLSRQLIVHNNLTTNPLVAGVPSGTLPTNDFNASTIKTDTGDRAIVLNSGVVAFMSEVLNSFLGIIPLPGTVPLWSRQEAVIRVVQWAVAISTGRARLGLTKTPGFSNPRLMSASGSVGDISRIFILGHEYGHFLLGHLNDANTKVKALAPDMTSYPVEFYIKQQEQEFEADAKGFELCIEWCKKTHNGRYQVAFLAIVFVFHLLTLIEMNTAETDRDLVHPPASERRKQFEKIYYDQFDTEIKLEIAYLDQFMAETYQFLKRVQAEFPEDLL